MYNFMRASLVACLLGISSAANAASTFVISLPLGFHIDRQPCVPAEGSDWTPCTNNPNFYSIIDLRGVVALRMRAQGNYWNPNYPDPYYPAAPSYIGLQISIDGGYTFNCVPNGSECLSVTIPSETANSSDVLILPSVIVELPRHLRSENAILKIAVLGDDRVDVDLVQVQFYRLF